MDKPLKYFLIASFVFLTFVVFIIINGRQNKAEVAVIPNDYPLIHIAGEQAIGTIDSFYRYYPLYPDKAFVKFRSKAGDLWGRVLYVKDGYIKAAPINVPNGGYNMEVPNEIELAAQQLLDWLIELPDGKIRGGYSSQAIFIFEKTQSPSEKIDSQLQLFVDKINEE